MIYHQQSIVIYANMRRKRQMEEKKMSTPTGFMEYKRELPSDRDPLERIKDWNEFHRMFSEEQLRTQGRAAWIAEPHIVIRAWKSEAVSPVVRLTT